jgi:hypothetical protein
MGPQTNQKLTFNHFLRLVSNMYVYTLKEHKETGESHLFKATKSTTELNKCIPVRLSACQKMNKDEYPVNRFACLSEDAARIEIASIGRPVCGICVSTLYTTPR